MVFNAYQDLGIDKANSLNRAAIQSLAPIEMQRTKKVLGVVKEKFDTFDELKDFMLEALELIMPHSIFEKASFSAPSRDLLHWEWASGECFAYKGMKQVGILDGYRCGIIYRIECWLKELGIKYSINPEIDKCIMHEKGACSGDIRIFLGS